jgi:plasmid maintenance system killer protein
VFIAESYIFPYPILSKPVPSARWRFYCSLKRQFSLLPFLFAAVKHKDLHLMPANKFGAAGDDYAIVFALRVN